MKPLKILTPVVLTAALCLTSALSADDDTNMNMQENTKSFKYVGATAVLANNDHFGVGVDALYMKKNQWLVLLGPEWHCYFWLSNK